MSVFLSVDPLAEDYPNINPYVYVANNPINFVDPDGRKIVPTGMSKTDLQNFNKRIDNMRADNKLFNTVYSSLENSEKIHTIGFGDRIITNEKMAAGQVSPTENGSSIIFGNEGFNNDAVLFEEIFHAYQVDNGFDNSELNVEFEAKTGAIFMNKGTIGDEGIDYDFIFTIDDINMNIDKNYKDINNQGFLNDYKEAANKFSKYNRDKNIGTLPYKKDTTSEPNNLKKMINDTYNK